MRFIGIVVLVAVVGFFFFIGLFATLAGGC